jgi:hypothetical protein
MTKQAISGKTLRGKSRHYVTCPETGNIYLMRRPNITHLINSGALPENFVAKTLQVLGREVKPASSELTDADLLKGEAVMRAMVTAAMLQPRIVENATTDDECEFYDIPAEDRRYLFLWAKGELPEVPLETTSGEETTVAAVESFPVPEERGEPESPLNSSSPFWWQTQPITRTM